MNKLAIAVMSVVLWLTLPGCGERPVQPLRVGLPLWPGYEIVYLAEHQGAFGDSPIQLVEFHSPAEALRAYDVEALDVIGVTIDYALQAASGDSGQRIVMVVDESLGGDALLARPEIVSLSELRGQRVGIERSALGAYMLKRALDHGGLERHEVVVQSVDIPAAVDAYRAGGFDAVITYEPYRTRIMEIGARELFSSRDIPGEIVDVLLTRQSVIDEYGASLAALIEGSLAAAERMPEASDSQIRYLARRENVTMAQFLQSLQSIRLYGRADNRKLLVDSPPDILPVLRRHTEIMLEEGMIDEPPDLQRLIEGRFVRPSQR